MSHGTRTIAEEIWNIANELRVSGQEPSLKDLVIAANVRGVRIDWKAVYGISSAFCSREFAMIPPPYVVRFLSSYFSDQAIQKAMDPNADFGALLTGLVEGCSVRTGLGIVREQGHLAVAQVISDSRAIRWVLGDLSKLDRTERFDLVVSFPSPGMKLSVETFATTEGPVTVRDQEGNLLVLRSCLMLGESGQAVFVLPNSFFMRNRPDNVLSLLSKFGLHMNAVIALPGALVPWTSIDVNMVFISRSKTDQLFVARLDPVSDPKLLIENLRQRHPGPAIELGTLIESSRFTSWRALVLDEEIKELAAQSGLHPVRLSEISEAISLGNRSEDGGFEAKSNTVYLPLIGYSPAVTSLKDLRIKPQNYAQIVLRAEFALSDYVAGFFNTVLGQKVREKLASGGIIQRVTRETLPNAVLFIPAIDLQTEIVNTHRSIRELTLQLEQHERALWSRPADVARVRKDVASINQKESFESWIETLPFPLASILWRYHADAEFYVKNTHLLHFFEALAQFMSGLLLSAFHSDKEFFEANKSNWFDWEHERPRLLRSSFGDWIVFGERFAKLTRQMLLDDRRSFCLGLFRVTTADLLNALTSKDLYATLKTVNQYRNDWKGHGGVAGQKEELRRVDLLQRELTRVREIFASSFEQLELIAPVSSEYAQGIFHYMANSLKGTRIIFRQIRVESLIPMEKGKIYLLDINSRKPLEILPFFRIRPSPKTEENVCYFYNRVEKEGVRWISYHFEPEAELVEADEEIVRIIEELGGPVTGGSQR